MQNQFNNNQAQVNGLGVPPAMVNTQNQTSQDSFSPSDTFAQDTTPTTSNSYSSNLSDGTISNPNLTDLNLIKQEALNKLQPLINDLDLDPDEKFKTLMMMIQASDNKNLISDAYQQIDQIKEPKQKAQALLDIVNEINYFNHIESQTD
jgi:hypothetical protein